MRKLSAHVHVVLALAVTGFVLGGCAVQAPLPDAMDSSLWKAHESRLAGVERWTLNGRIAVQLEKDSGSASLRWQQSGEEYVIRIIAPLGRGTLELQGNGQGVIMHTADGQMVHASDPELLLQDYMGWQVPLAGLHYWIRGIPDPSVKITTLILDRDARISALSQAGWQVSYGAYVEADGLSMPARLVMQNGRLRVKLVIRQWDLGS